MHIWISAPPPLRPPCIHSHDECVQALPVFCWSTVPVYCCECKRKVKVGEAWERGYIKSIYFCNKKIIFCSTAVQYHNTYYALAMENLNGITASLEPEQAPHYMSVIYGNFCNALHYLVSLHHFVCFYCDRVRVWRGPRCTWMAGPWAKLMKQEATSSLISPREHI